MAGIRTFRAAAFVLASGLTLLFLTSVLGQNESPDTTRILDRIESSRAKLTPADVQAAHKLNLEGDKAYRQGKFKAAFTAYSNSYPNAPNAYAYIMAGDSHWRAVAQEQTSKPGTSAAKSGTCQLDNQHFTHDLSMDVAQNQAVGLALATRDNDRKQISSKFFRRARESTACLNEMAEHYQVEPKSACVDLDRLRRCLGAPLIK